MNTPNLDRIVHALVRIDTMSPPGRETSTMAAYYDEMRERVVKPVRALQESNDQLWFSLLLHQREHMLPLFADLPSDRAFYAHLRFDAGEEIKPQAFVEQHCDAFMIARLSPEGQLESLAPDHHALGWKVFGESSAMVLSLIEAYDGPTHDGTVPLPDVAQFLHYIVNPLLLGHRGILLPFHVNAMMTF